MRQSSLEMALPTHTESYEKFYNWALGLEEIEFTGGVILTDYL